MPIRHTDNGWYWGSKGPFATRAKAQQIANAAYANGYKEESQMDYSVQSFVLCLLHSVTNAHILHLQTKSYSEHKALESFYTEIGDLVDDYVEAYQCKYGIIEGYKAEYELPPSPLEYLTGLNDYVLQARQQLKQDTELQNLTDEIAQLIDSTLYKLRFLK
jgi:hypothetical protein